MNKVHLSESDIDAMDKLHRVRFVTSLPGYKSLNLVGTQDGSRHTNLSIVSSVTHLASNPPLLGYFSRPDSVERHTLTNIKKTKHLTFNHVNQHIFKEAHQTSARYPAEGSEFEAVGLTPEWKSEIPAPFVAEAHVSVHLELEEILPIPSSGTLLVVGRVRDVYLSENLLHEDGSIELQEALTLAGTALDGYYLPEQLARLSYAKVGLDPQEI